MNSLFVFLIFVFVLILYGSTVRNKYALDDHLVAYPNEQIAQGFSAIPEIFTTRYATEADLSYGYRPIFLINGDRAYHILSIYCFML
jgi:hypothetical protein